MLKPSVLPTFVLREKRFTCASAWNVDVLVHSDVFLSRKSYMYKCV